MLGHTDGDLFLQLRSLLWGKTRSNTLAVLVVNRIRSDFLTLRFELLDLVLLLLGDQILLGDFRTRPIVSRTSVVTSGLWKPEQPT